MIKNQNSKKATIKREKRVKELRDAINNLKASQPIGDPLPCPKKYGILVRKFRKLSGYSIQALADKVGMTRQSMSDIENGKRAAVDPELMYMIAVVIGCSIHNLMGLTEELNEVLVEGQPLKSPVAFCPPEEVDLAKALLKIHRTHPNLEKKIVLLAQYGTNSLLDKADDLLSVGLREFFCETVISNK